MKFAIRKVGSVSILEIEGKMSIGVEADLAEAFRQLIDAGTLRLVVNMSDVVFLDSGGLAEIIRFYKRAVERQAGVRLVMTPSGKPLQILRITGLTKVFEIYSAEPEAIASFTD